MADDPAARLSRVREQLTSRGIDAFCVPRADEYLGEYLPVHNERLRWLTGFTGSAGMAVVLADSAAMFVDGRYTVQVRHQVDGAQFEYCHLIETPPLRWLASRLDAGARVLVDPRMCTLDWFNQAKGVLDEVGAELVLSTDNPIDTCWTDRPTPSVTPALLLEERFTGESSLSKRSRLGQVIRDKGADHALVFAPDSVSWLLNVRGSDVPRVPVLLSFAILSADGNLRVFVDPGRIPEDFAAHVGEGVSLADEAETQALLENEYRDQRVLADPATANAWAQLALKAGGATLIAAPDPVLLPKACKNACEVEGARRAHRRDAVAEVRFLAWLDREVGAGRLHSEAVLADRLAGLRAENEHFHELSFDTISAAAANGAMCHYNHLDNPTASIEMGSLYLVDSGGQYSDGTTDITRTVAIGKPDADMCELFTLVLKGHIALDGMRFPPGTTGTHLDAIARQFLWQTGRDYDHGTGHGVGSFLSVHEGPQRIAKAWNSNALRPGMIVSNEPGYYRDGAFGIRCENLCVVVEVASADHEVPMLGFEALTLVPFDQRLIQLDLLTDAELTWINDYHQRVADALAPLLQDAQDSEWLREATAPLVRLA